MCVLYGSHKTIAIFSLCSINWLPFINVECVYCVIKMKTVYAIQVKLVLWRINRQSVDVSKSISKFASQYIFIIFYEKTDNDVEIWINVGWINLTMSSIYARRRIDVQEKYWKIFNVRYIQVSRNLLRCKPVPVQLTLCPPLLPCNGLRLKQLHRLENTKHNTRSETLLQDPAPCTGPYR